ncbi:hypothetical protein CDEST_06780 [Colletotrichum destructivum]|uniref:Uncharacterized protein n=1 Tax=Colletotrichum destructivum TaxID=34406 RepID=A0AAX4IF77_9PEZI|nr:hypothetical protein CDEST_06780 [Colletotrichum destructivum]
MSIGMVISSQNPKAQLVPTSLSLHEDISPFGNMLMSAIVGKVGETAVVTKARVNSRCTLVSPLPCWFYAGDEANQASSVVAGAAIGGLSAY